MRRRLLLLLSLVSVAALAAGCGSDDADTGATSTTVAATKSFPVTIENGERSVVVEKRPARIVSLSPTATEMLFAIGAGKQVKAADSFSNFPPEAPKTDLNAHEPNVEAVAAHKPDLVVLSNDPGSVIDAFEKLGVDALLLGAATTLDDTYAQIEVLGKATGHAPEAAAVVTRIRTDIDRIVEQAQKAKGLRYYHELDPTYFSATSKTFIGAVYSLLGLQNIADAADKDGSGYPQVSAEYVVEQDPDLIFLADTKCCKQSAESVAARPGWRNLRAVRSGAVVALDDDVASRWGPRIVELLRAVAAATEKAAAAKAAAA